MPGGNRLWISHLGVSKAIVRRERLSHDDKRVKTFKREVEENWDLRKHLDRCGRVSEVRTEGSLYPICKSWLYKWMHRSKSTDAKGSHIVGFWLFTAETEQYALCSGPRWWIMPPRGSIWCERRTPLSYCLSNTAVLSRTGMSKVAEGIVWKILFSFYV